MTNFEQIKNMSVDEMVDFINDGRRAAPCTRCGTSKSALCFEIACPEGVKMWLESEAEE